MSVRKPDFAGTWYPGRASDCREAIEEFEKDPYPCESSQRTGFGGIVPHAGWYYSGRIAFSVISCLRTEFQPETVVLFGRHLRSGGGNFIMKEGEWETPLGNLEIDRELAEALISEFPFKVETPSVYAPDNTIELQLPFIKYFFPETKILPLGVPPNKASLKIGERVGELSRARASKTLMIGSTDLTHYGYNYGFTPKGVGRDAVEWVKTRNDRAVIDRMLQMEAEEVIEESLRNGNACCAGAVAAAITAVKTLGAAYAHEMVYTTSYDIRPDTSFVGYVGILFS